MLVDGLEVGLLYLLGEVLFFEIEVAVFRKELLLPFISGHLANYNGFGYILRYLEGFY